MTPLVPPGSFVHNGAVVTSPIVIILISSGERHTAMIIARESPEFPDKMSRSMSVTFDQLLAVRNSKEILKYQISII